MKKILIIMLASLALGFSGSAWAVEEGAVITTQSLGEQQEAWRTKREEMLSGIKRQKEAFKALREKFTEERCARIQERIENREANFEDIKEKHLSVYTNLIERINKFLARFEEAKLDTATLKGHLTELQAKIDKFKDDYAAYAAKLGESKNLTCGHSEGEFKSGLLEAKALLKTVHADAADIRIYVRETIFVDLKDLKAQMPKAEEKADGANETEGGADDNQE